MSVDQSVNTSAASSEELVARWLDSVSYVESYDGALPSIVGEEED